MNTLEESADIVIQNVLNLTAGEQFLIITNPDGDVAIIARALFDAALKRGAEATLVIQPVKTQLDFANKAALAAFDSIPAVCASISANKIGKDSKALAHPYTGLKGNKVDHIFNFQLDETKTLRAIWTPGITVDMFKRTAGIDYTLLQKRCKALCEVLAGSSSIHVTAPGGTDITIQTTGRKPFTDDGDFTRGGTGGNIPAGEVFISPLPGKSDGVIVFDGSLSLNSCDLITETPVRVVYKNGFITEITGGKEAVLLEESIQSGEKKAREFVAAGKLEPQEGENHARNARGLGELGIGLNPAAQISGNMLEDEKAFHTCHFAIGSNYDNDADAMIHLDCLVKNPTIEVHYPDGRTQCIEIKGQLEPQFDTL